MECPKCRKELSIRRFNTNSDNGYLCQNRHFYTDKECEQIEYQQRLYKVLNRFERIEEYPERYEFNELRYHPIKIVKYDGDDYFVIMGRTGFKLDTVESILKDMEAQDE